MTTLSRRFPLRTIFKTRTILIDISTPSCTLLSMSTNLPLLLSCASDRAVQGPRCKCARLGVRLLPSPSAWAAHVLMKSGVISVRGTMQSSTASHVATAVAFSCGALLFIVVAVATAVAAAQAGATCGHKLGEAQVFSSRHTVILTKADGTAPTCRMSQSACSP